jgi:hypothetical protein
MRLCPACGNQYPDDANFCPMDATRLPPPAAAPVAMPPPSAPPPVAPPVASAPVVAAAPEAATVLASQSQANAIAGRFLVSGAGIETPTGTLFDARDTAQGGAQVAIKVVAPSVLPNASMADRALRELKQLAKVSSERIVRVVDQGRTSDGRLYVATEPPVGIALDELIGREGPLPLERAAAIVLQAGEALTEAQKVGVIHRDVAPRNLLIGPGDQVKVGEFGLAEPVSDKVFGAPAYLSPEQVEGRPVDQRSNIYSLGSIFYHALTGAPPFAGDTPALLAQQVNATPTPPSHKRPGLSPELDRVILKSLEKSGGRRHLTLRQFLSEVDAARSAKPPAITVPNMPAITTPNMPAMASPPPATTPSLPVATAPSAPVAAGRPAMAATVMGIPSPTGRPEAAPGGPGAAPPAAPPMMIPAAPTSAPPDARTVMAEAPRNVPPQPRNVPVSASPEVHAAVAQAQAKVAAQAQPAQGGFRDTAWFKVGEIEEERAKMEAAAAARAGGDVLAPTGTTGKQGAVDVDGVDVSAADRARLSLKTGATQRMAVIGGAGLGADRMDESEMLAEIDSSRKWFLVAGGVVATVVLAVVLYFVLKKPPVPAPAPVAKPAVAAQPVTPPPARPVAPAPVAPSVAPAPAATAAQLLTEAEHLAAKDDLAPAIDALTRAQAAGASGRDVKRLEAALGRAVGKRMSTAKHHRDRAGEAEAKALAARLRALKSHR